MCVLSCVWLFGDTWTVAHQAPLTMEFSRQGYWSGMLFPTPGDLPDPVIEPRSFKFAALESGFFTTGATWGAQLQMWIPSFFYSCWKEKSETEVEGEREKGRGKGRKWRKERKGRMGKKEEFDSSNLRTSIQRLEQIIYLLRLAHCIMQFLKYCEMIEAFWGNCKEF